MVLFIIRNHTVYYKQLWYLLYWEYWLNNLPVYLQKYELVLIFQFIREKYVSNIFRFTVM